MDTQKYEAVRKAVIAAVPEIAEVCRGQEINHFCPNCSTSFGRPIRLADVMVALEGVTNNAGYLVLTGKMNFEETKRWNYRQDDLSLQSPECIDFLHSILVE